MSNGYSLYHRKYMAYVLPFICCVGFSNSYWIHLMLLPRYLEESGGIFTGVMVWLSVSIPEVYGQVYSCFTITNTAKWAHQIVNPPHVSTQYTIKYFFFFLNVSVFKLMYCLSSITLHHKTANISWRTCVVVKQMQSNTLHHGEGFTF